MKQYPNQIDTSMNNTFNMPKASMSSDIDSRFNNFVKDYTQSQKEIVVSIINKVVCLRIIVDLLIGAIRNGGCLIANNIGIRDLHRM